MLPLRDEDRVRGVPWLTWLLIAANTAGFAFEARTYLVSGPTAMAALVDRWAFLPSRLVADPASPTAWATLLTSMFLHAGWLHLAGNMLYLWIFGPRIEIRLGRARFLGFYLLCGLAATAAQSFASPHTAVGMVGASGAISGLLGAYLLLFPRARITTAVFMLVYFELASLPAAVLIVVWFALQLAGSIASSSDMAAGGIAYVAHIGGFVAGMLAASFAWNADRSTRKAKRR